MTSFRDTQAEDFLNKMPEGLPQSRMLLDEYIATVPAGTPPQVLSLLRRTFIAGAVSHLEVVRAAFALPSLEEGDPTELLNAVAALGVGAQVLMEEEDHIIRSGQNKPADGPRIVLASSNEHAFNYDTKVVQ